MSKLFFSYFSLLNVLITVYPILTFAQPSQSIEWQKCLGGTKGDFASGIISTREGGYIVVGTTSSNDGDVKGAPPVTFSGWIVRLDKFGEILWSRCIDGDGVSSISSIIQTTDGGFLIAGRTSSVYVGVGKTHGLSDALIIKLNKDGELIWQKTYGGTSDDVATVVIENLQREGGGYIFVGNTSSNDGDVAGHHSSSSTDSSDAWVVKINYNGEIEWQKCLGGEKGDYANSIIQTWDGGFALAGYTYSQSGDVTGHYKDSTESADAWVVKLSYSGNIEWQRCLGGSRTDIATSITNAIDSGIIVGGYTDSPDSRMDDFHLSTLPFGAKDAFIAHLNKNGTVLWQKCYGGNADELINTIIPTKDNSFLFVGSTSSNDGDVLGIHVSNGGNSIQNDVWLAKVNIKGGLEWQKCLGGSYWDIGRSIAIAIDGDIIFVGSTQSFDGDIVGPHYDGSTSNPPADIWVVKLGISAGVTEPSDFDYRSLVLKNFLKIYPNPSSSSAHLEMLSWFNAKGVEIYNLLGTKISCETTLSENGANVNVKSLPNGTYIVRVAYTSEKVNGTFTLPLIVYH